MTRLTKAEQYLLDQIRRGDGQGWSQLVDRFQGRLLAFAQAKIGRYADAEDVVQETFVGFLKGIHNYHGDAGLETYLFTILRRNIISNFRSKAAQKICLLQDVIAHKNNTSSISDPFGHIPGSCPTASWYVRRDEQADQLRLMLSELLRDWLDEFKKSLKFTDLKIIELLFYCQLPNKQIAEMMHIRENNVAVNKHRYLEQIRQRLSRVDACCDLMDMEFECLLTEIWETHRLSCPKRSTIGAFLLETLEANWIDYIHFHLNQLGCQFCLANLNDLKQQNSSANDTTFRKRIMESTVGFLKIKS